VHQARNPITSDWPDISNDPDYPKIQQDINNGDNAGALDQLVAIMKKYCCNFDTMAGGAPTYDKNLKSEGSTQRKKGGAVKIGPDAFASAAWLYSSLKHEMVHSQQWQDPAGAAASGVSGREKQAYQREIDQAGNTHVTDAQKQDLTNRKAGY